MQNQWKAWETLPLETMENAVQKIKVMKIALRKESLYYKSSILKFF